MKKIIIIGLLVVLALILIFSKKTVDNSNLEPEPSMVTPGGASGQFAAPSGDQVLILEQLPGSEVFVNGVSLDSSGFVIIKKDESGSAGKIVGVSEFLTKGDYSGIDVGLIESMSDGLKYYLSLYEDDGNGIFDPKEDKEVKSNSNIEFMVNNDAENPRLIEINY